MTPSWTFAAAVLMVFATLMETQTCLAAVSFTSTVAGMSHGRSAGVTNPLPPDPDDVLPVGAPLPHYLFRLTPERHAAAPAPAANDPSRPEDGGFVATLDAATHAER